MHEWKIVPLSKGQLLDINEKDVIYKDNVPLYRYCQLYKGGGGYDKFPKLSEQILGTKISTQFIVQLYGCNLDCPYCYVTRAGVWGDFVRVTTKELLHDYMKASMNTEGTLGFHLMGGAPALQLKYWPELLKELSRIKGKWTFTSDMTLTESYYSMFDLLEIAKYKNNVLIAVNIKGYNEEEWYKNTRKKWNKDLFRFNLQQLIEYEVPFYTTFTNVSDKSIKQFNRIYGAKINNQYKIDLINYKALPYVDEVAWGIT